MSFEEIYTGKLFGAIRGFDRLRFRGTIRELNTGGGITRVLNYLHILMKDFKFFFKSITDAIVLNAKGYCQARGIQYIWRMGGRTRTRWRRRCWARPLKDAPDRCSAWRRLRTA